MRVLALIDGEHHPGVYRETLDRLSLEHELAAVLFVGGEEKVGEAALADPVTHYGRAVTVAGASREAALQKLAANSDLEAVIDLSGEPVLDAQARFRLASVALHAGLEYRTAGLRLSPPPRERLVFDGPVVEVIGTGKRTGKTAVAGHFASLLRERGVEPVIVSMGRGGPSGPQLVHADERPDLDALRQIARAGRHAASDYLEDAVLAGVSCVGCRRTGEGLAGEVFESNVLEGAALALTLGPDVLLVEGSGAAFPPIASDRTVCVTSARAENQALADLGPYRLLCSDLIAVMGADALSSEELERLKQSLAGWCEDAPIVGCRFDPEPATPVSAGARVAIFTTATGAGEAPFQRALARDDFEIAFFSSNLARRSALEGDLERAERERCDVFLTELKAAAIEVVAERAAQIGAEVVFLRNRPVSLPGEPDLDNALLHLLEQARVSDRAGVAPPASQ